MSEYINQENLTMACSLSEELSTPYLALRSAEGPGLLGPEV